MPDMQRLLSSANAAFSAEAIDGADSELADAYRPGPDTSLVDALDRTPGVNLDDAARAFLNTFPTGLQRSVQALIWENFSRDARVPITFAWQPGYDYSITVHDVLDTNTSRGGITVVFTSRYPADPHPLNGPTAS